MNKMRIAFCLLLAIPMTLLIILCAEATHDVETHESKGNIVSPLFVSSIDRFIKSDAQNIQTNYIGRSGDLPDSFYDTLFNSRDGEETIAFHDGNIINGIGPSFLRYEWEAAARITPQELEPFEGWEIVAGRFYHWESHWNEGVLKIYDEGTATNPGELIGSEPYNVSGAGWKRINLTTPVPVDATRDIWTSFLIVKNGAGEYPMGLDDGPAVNGKGDWISINDDEWVELKIYGLDYNLAIDTILRESPFLKAWLHGPYKGLPGEEIHFRGGASGGSPPYNWFWDFGDNTTSTDRYPSHAYQSIGNYTVTLTVNDSNASTANASTWALIAHVPPTNPNITGPHYGRPGIVYTFCIQGVTDPEGDAIYCIWNWGDGNVSGWLGPFNSGEPFCASHVWSQEDTYMIRVKCKDIYGTESAWSDPFIIIIEAGEPVVKIIKPQRAIYIHNKSILPRLFGMSLIIGDIDIIVNASDNVSGIERVEFFIDEELKANFTAPPFSFLWTKDNGLHLFHIHIIKSVVYDNAGNSADSKIFVRRFF
jgi:hypothetical protein